MSEIYKHSINPQVVLTVYNQKPPIIFSQAKQVHGAHLIPYSEGLSENLNEADGIYISKNNMDVSKKYNLAIRTADCLPVALIGTDGFANIHAGWKGLAANILSNENIKNIKPKIALIGPSIQVQNYEVGEQFYQNFISKRSFENINGKIHFNLQKEAQLQLKDEYPGIKIINSGICTFEAELLHSFRREKNEDRNWNILTVSL